MMKTAIVSVISSVGALIATVSMPLTFLASPAQDHQHEQVQAVVAPSASDQSEAMAQMHQQMMARMKDGDTRLAELSEAMNDASGQAKTDAMADLLNEMVAQRRSMHEHMMPMHERMMQHMMEHMAAAMPEEMRKAMHESMMQCPMMKHVHGQDEPGAHGDHDGDGSGHGGIAHNNHGHSER